MSILTWIEDKKRLKILNAPKYSAGSTDSSEVLWTRCDKCGEALFIKHLKQNKSVCSSCSYHLQMMSVERIENLLDKTSINGIDLSTWRPLDETVSPCDPLEFHDKKAYTDRLQDTQERTGLQDAIQTGTGMIEGIPVALAVMDFSFMGGSMGSVVGEKITRLIEYATGEGLTLIIVSASGGARMQEGVFSLMQMAKISSALQIYQSCAKLLYISLLTSPTTGGVTASFAMLGDIIFAEPKAVIGFAGRRVIELTLREDLPDDFQTSEYMFDHGLVDDIVPRRFLREALSETIIFYQEAPFKKRGHIPFGVQNPISFLTEEKIRRGWGGLTSPGTKAIFSKKYNSSKPKLNEGLKESNFCVHFSSRQSKHSAKKLHESPKETIKSSIAKISRSGNEKSEPFRTKPYREILTSFEIMLALFVSSHSKKEGQPTVSSQKLTPNNSSTNFVSAKIKSSFSLYNNFILRAHMCAYKSSYVRNLRRGEKIKNLDVLASHTLYRTRTSNAKGGNKYQANASYACKRTSTSPKRSFVRRFVPPSYKSSYKAPLCTCKKEKRARKKICTHSLCLSLSPKVLHIFDLYGHESTFDNKNLSNNNNHSFQIEDLPKRESNQAFVIPTLARRKQNILGQSRKNKPLYSILKNDFACYTKQGFSREDGKPCPKNLSIGLRSNRTLQKPTFLSRFCDAKLETLFSQKSGLFKSKENWSTFAARKWEASLLQKPGSLKSWKFSKLLGVAFTNKYFFKHFRKGCKALLFNKFLSCVMLASTKKSFEKHRFALSNLHARRDKSSIRVQAESYVRLKQSFLQRVIFDYGFCSTSVTSTLENTYNKHIFGGDPAKVEALRKPSHNEEQVGPVKATSSKSFYTNKIQKQNRADLSIDMPTFSLLYNFRRLAQVTLASNTLQTSDLQISPEKAPTEQKRDFYDTQNQATDVASFLNQGINVSGFLNQVNLADTQNGTVFNRLANKKDITSQTKKLNKSSSISKNALVTDFTSAENDIDFLNQAIELAATESVEWRAFYIHQQLSENIGFLDDFLQQEGVNDNKTQKQTTVHTDIFRPFSSQLSNGRNQIGNVLYYQSLCRSKKLFST